MVGLLALDVIVKLNHIKHDFLAVFFVFRYVQDFLALYRVGVQEHVVDKVRGFFGVKIAPGLGPPADVFSVEASLDPSFDLLGFYEGL